METVPHNAAGRLLRLLDIARRRPGHKPAADMWGDVFDIRVPAGVEREREVALCLEARLKDRDKVNGYLAARFESGLGWSEEMKAVTDALSPGKMTLPWNKVIGHIGSSGALSTLGLVSQMMPAEIPQGDVKAVAQVRRDATAAAEFVNNSDLPEIIKALLVDQLKRIGRAAEAFDHSGSIAIIRGFEHAAEHLSGEAEVLRPHVNSPAVTMVRRLWKLLCAAVSISVAVVTLPPQIEEGIGWWVESIRTAPGPAQITAGSPPLLEPGTTPDGASPPATASP